MFTFFAKKLVMVPFFLAALCDLLEGRLVAESLGRFAEGGAGPKKDFMVGVVLVLLLEPDGVVIALWMADFGVLAMLLLWLLANMD